MIRRLVQRVVLGIAGLVLCPVLGQAADLSFNGPIILSDPCAVFAMPNGPSVTPINYGEVVVLDVKGNIQTSINLGKDSAKYSYAISVRGDGTGSTSGIRYSFSAKAAYKASVDLNPMALDLKFKMTARLMGQSKTDGSGAIVQGAQDNALLRFYVNLKAANGGIQAWASDFTLECGASPWTNMMNAPEATTRTPVGRGFGDPWNKYAWSMKDFGGGMLVGTKNAHFNYFAIDGNDDDPVVTGCINNPALPIPSIYKSLACLELFGPPGLDGAATSYAEIWRFDYSKKDWSRMKDDFWSQGFRIMETHNNKLYVGSDLGAFVTGVNLGSGPGSDLTNPKWDFPGSRLLSSEDGKSFSEVSCVPGPEVDGPCDSATGAGLGADVNVSFRALASYNGKLYLGTFNYAGAELWEYTETDSTWKLITKFSSPVAGVTELQVYDNTLYIGLFGPSGLAKYLYTYDGTNLSAVAVEGLDTQKTIGVLKLFVGKSRLFAGYVGLENGFNLLSYDGEAWTSITSDGFFNKNNAYAWSMAEVDGRLFLGTFNQDFFATVPRGSAELWYSDDGSNWQQAALPLDWGIWNYGIRTIVLGSDKQLWLGTASNMIAPGLPDIVLPLSPGAEVWTIKANDVDPKK